MIETGQRIGETIEAYSKHKVFEEKRGKIINLISDVVADIMYYDRKEDDELSVSDMNEICTPEFIEDMVSKFREELLKAVK